MLTVISDTLRPPPPQLWTPSVAPYVIKTLLEHKGIDSLPVGTCEVLEAGQLALLLGEHGGGASQDVAREVADAVSCDEWPWVGGPYLFKGEVVIHQEVRNRVRACKRKRQRVGRRRQRAGTDLPRLPPNLPHHEPLDPAGDWDEPWASFGEEGAERPPPRRAPSEHSGH